MARRFSAWASTAWLGISVVLILLPKIYCEDLTPCGEVILLDSDLPSAQITSTDEQYRHGWADDDATKVPKVCLWYFRSPPGTTIRLDVVTLEPVANPLIVYDGLDIEVDDDQGIEIGGSYENSFISSGRGLTCKLPTQLNDTNQENAVTLQATLQGEISIEAVNPGECGGTIYLNENSTTSLLNFTSFYPYGGAAYCYWYIYSPSNTYTIVEFFDWQSLDYNDYLYIYDSRGRQIFRVSGHEFHQEPYPVISDYYARVKFGTSYSVPDTYFGMKVSYTDKLRHDTDGVIQSSGGVIELNENTTSLTVQFVNLMSNYSSTDSFWFFTGPTGKRLKAEFHQVGTGYLTIYDSSGTSRIISSYSDVSPTSENVFIENVATMRLSTRSYMYEGDGLLFTISVIDDYSFLGQQTCGGTIVLDSYEEYFIFNSPYYYSQQLPSGHTDCYWYVTSPVGKQVQLVWLDIETSSDYLRVYDYPSSTFYQVSEFRGNVDIDLSPIVSSRGGITIYLDDYRSYATRGRGFLANVSLSNTTYYLSPACGGSIQLTQSSPNVTFSTPFYYQLSTSNIYMDCFWYITSPSGKQVQLTVLDLETRSERVYIFDHVTTSHSYWVSELSGRLESPATVMSSQGGLKVRYHDYSSGYNGPGLLLQARNLDSYPDFQPGFCGGTVALTTSSPNFTFTLPFYNNPSTSAVTTDCYMYINCPSGKQVQLTIRDFNTTNEEIEVYDHPTSGSHLKGLISRLSGQLDSQTVMISSRGGLTLFYDDNSSGYNGPGAFVEARILDTTPSDNISDFCGGVIPLSTSTPRVTTTTPLFYQPSPSAVLMECWWYVTSPSGKQVEMSIHELQTENEYVYVYDYPSSSSYQVSRLRGNVSDSTVVSTRGGFSVVFDDTSSSGNGPGFAMDVALTDEFTWDDEGIDSCGQTIYLDSSSPSIVFRTPTYPIEVLNDQYNCYWYVTCPYGYRIHLLFHDFDTYSNSRFTVYDNSFTSSTYQLAEVSSTSIPGTAPIQSSSNRLTAYYYDADWSDVTKQRGVVVNASIVQSGEPTWDNTGPMSSCGSAIALNRDYSRVELTTPDYPDVKGNYYECTWFVQCPSQTSVRIDFNDFWVDYSGYFRVHDGPTTGYSVILQASGTSLHGGVLSSSNTMTAFYYKNRGTSGKGASFAVSCLFEDATTQSTPETDATPTSAPEPEPTTTGTPETDVTTPLTLEPDVTTPSPSEQDVHVDCDSTSMTVLLNRRLLSNGTNAADVHFKSEYCVGIDYDTTQIVLHTGYDRCSTESKETETSIIYSNVVTYYSPRTIIGTGITRENILKIPVQCKIDRHRLLGDSFVPKTGEVTFNETGYGDFSLRLDRYTDATFDEFADDDDGEIALGEHLYFAVNLTSVAGLTVFIENCWATPSQYPNDANNYAFLSNGCSEDPTMHLISFPDPSFAPFVIDAFTFIEENPQVFIHCEVLVCEDNNQSSRCAQGCQSRFRRGSRHTRETSSSPHLISNGPLYTFHQRTHVVETDDGDLLV